MEQVEHLEPPAAIAPMTEARPLLRAWWQLVDMRIGTIPLPLFPRIIAQMVGFVWLGKLPSDLTMVLCWVLMSVRKSAGTSRSFAMSVAPAIIATFLPSCLVYAHCFRRQ